MRLIGLMGLMGLIGLMSSCSSEELEEPLVQKGTAIELTPYASSFEEEYGTLGGYKANETNETHETNETNGTYETNEISRAYSPATRAWAAPYGYYLYDDVNSVDIALTKDGVAPLIGQFYKDGGKWRTNIDLEETTYYLYGTAPHMPVIDFNITDRDGTNAHYSNGAIITLDKVPSIISDDPCVVIGAKYSDNKETVTGLRQGDFAYAAKAINVNGEGKKVDGGNFVFLLFDHLYAGLRIKMKVDPDYDTMRTIKVKKLSMRTLVGDTPTKEKMVISITLQPTDGTTSPIADLTFTPRTESPDIGEEGMQFWSSTSGETLTTGVSTFTGHFMPVGVTTLALTSEYDIYDKAGNLVREGCKATNTMVLSELFTEQYTTRRGCRYTVNMTIKPTYLYVLSDPDLNNPSVTVE